MSPTGKNPMHARIPMLWSPRSLHLTRGFVYTYVHCTYVRTYTIDMTSHPMTRVRRTRTLEGNPPRPP